MVESLPSTQGPEFNPQYFPQNDLMTDYPKDEGGYPKKQTGRRDSFIEESRTTCRQTGARPGVRGEGWRGCWSAEAAS